MPPYRILALDGGEGFIAGALLGSIKNLLPPETTLLNDVKVFAGTSAGGVGALFLASRENPDDGLAYETAFYQAVWDSLSFRESSNICRALGAAAGVNALLSRVRNRDFFAEFFGATTRLGDLKHRVLITSFQLDNENPLHRSWKPKIFHNFSPNEPDLDEFVVDVAIRTSGVPVTYPIVQSITGTGPGYIDGGTFANNPSMCALAQVLGPIYREALPEEVLLLSMGNGQRPKFVAPRFVDGFADWGYRPWLLDPLDPLLLLDAVFQADSMAVDYQCRSLLERSYHRVDPVLPSLAILSGMDLSVIIARVLALQSSQLQIRAALDWVLASGWIPPAAPPVARETTVTQTTVTETTIVSVEIDVPPPPTEPTEE